MTRITTDNPSPQRLRYPRLSVSSVVKNGFPSLLLLTLALLAGGCTTVPRTWREPAPLSAEARAAHNARVFDRAAELTAARFFDATFGGVDWPAAVARHRAAALAAADDEALYDAINGLLAELGQSHNAALSPRQAFELFRRQRIGAGFLLRRLEGRWVVTEVMPASAAEAAGIRPGWLAVSRDGASLPAVAPRLATAEGQTVRYEFLDADDRLHAVSVTSQVLSTEPHREGRELAGGIVYLRFDDFDWGSRRWLSEQLKQHRAAPAVVVDLRQNPGGWIFSLEAILGEFFPSRVDIGTLIRRSGRESGLDTFHWAAARYPGRVAVLIDETSASSAEIFAHVMRHHGRAVLVGRRTAGAVIAANYLRLPGGGRLQVAVRDYLGLDGRRIEGRGVEPDVPVALTLANLRRDVDADLAAAVAVLSAPADATGT